MSANVVWNIVRKSSAYRVKRSGLDLSREPGNLTNTNTFKSSGLAQSKTVDVNLDARGNPTLAVSVPARANKPASSKFVVRLTRGKLARRAKNVTNTTSKVFFRRDLEKAALARLTRLHLARTRPGGVNKTPRARR
mmetsp:Transcript_61286/g.124343  ORF Transcript_61286/g.124343 Transcript_61286/m.124343 type:complete len:136 (+) Transcript_61286:60-467(+)